MEDAKQAGMDRAGELPMEPRVAERRAEPPALVTTMASTIVALKEQNESMRSVLKLALTGFEAFEESARGNSELWTPTIFAMDTIRAALASQPAAPVQPMSIEAIRKLALDMCATDAEGHSEEFNDGRAYGVAKMNAALMKLAAPPVQQPVVPSKLEIWKRMRGFIITDALNDRNITLPAHYANDLLEVFDKAMPATCTACNGTRCIAGALYDQPSECDLCADQEPPVQQPGDVRDLSAAIMALPSNYKGDPNFRVAFLDGFDAARKAAAALATRPRAALTDEQIMRMAGDMKQRNAGVWPGEVAFARALLAASSGALAVPEGWQPIATAPEDRTIDILMPNGVRWAGAYYDRICNEWRRITETGHMLRVKRDYPTHWHATPATPAIPAQGQTK